MSLTVLPSSNMIMIIMIGLYCSMARVAHSGMTADEVTENIEAAVRTAVAKLRMVSMAHQGWFSKLKNLPKIISTY